MRNIDTMDAKDWIILRLLRVCAYQTQARNDPDFVKAAYWAARNIAIFGTGPGYYASSALATTLAKEKEADLYIYKQWPQPDDADSIVPFEALLTSVQTNDN